MADTNQVDFIYEFRNDNSCSYVLSDLITGTSSLLSFFCIIQRFTATICCFKYGFLRLFCQVQILFPVAVVFLSNF